MGAGKLAMIQAKVRARALNVFVSYATDDLPGIRPLLQGATVPGVNLFVAEDKMPPGTKLTEAIEREIRTCDLFVVMWSKHAAESQWVRYEVGLASGAGRKILPVLLDASVPLPPYLANIKYITAEQSVQSAGAQLSAVLASDLGEKRAARSEADAFTLTLVVLGLLVAAGIKEK